MLLKKKSFKDFATGSRFKSQREYDYALKIMKASSKEEDNFFADREAVEYRSICSTEEQMRALFIDCLTYIHPRTSHLIPFIIEFPSRAYHFESVEEVCGFAQFLFACLDNTSCVGCHKRVSTYYGVDKPEDLFICN